MRKMVLMLALAGIVGQGIVRAEALTPKQKTVKHKANGTTKKTVTDNKGNTKVTKTTRE